MSSDEILAPLLLNEVQLKESMKIVNEIKRNAKDMLSL
jgi:hypothetical protein